MINILLDLIVPNVIGINTYFYLFLLPSKKYYLFLFWGLFLSIFIMKSWLYIILICIMAIISRLLFNKKRTLVQYLSFMLILFLMFINVHISTTSIIVFLIQGLIMYFWYYKHI